MTEKNHSGEYVLAFVKRTAMEYARRHFKGFLTRQDAEDAASRALEKIYNSRTKLDEERNPDGYLYTTAVNAVRQWALSKARYRLRVTPLDGFQGEDREEADGYREYPDTLPALGSVSDMPDARIIARETAEEIRRSLSGRNARVMDLRIQGFESGEIAERLGMSPSSAYMAVSHIKEHAKKTA